MRVTRTQADKAETGMVFAGFLTVCVYYRDFSHAYILDYPTHLPDAVQPRRDVGRLEYDRHIRSHTCEAKWILAGGET